MPPIKNQGCALSHLSSIQPNPQKVTTDANKAIPAA